MDSGFPGTEGNLRPSRTEGVKVGISQDKPAGHAGSTATNRGGNSSDNDQQESADANAFMQVLPKLLLLLVIAGFLWCCTIQHDAPASLEGIEAPEVLEAQPNEEAWENVPLPIIALLIVAGYALAILTMMYLPMWLGAEASIWLLLTALTFLLTWKWWWNLFLHVLLL